MQRTGTYDKSDRRDVSSNVRLRALCGALFLGALVFSLSPKAQAACVPGAADWMDSTNVLAAPVRPVDCAVTEQSPPDFGWPDLSADATYSVTLTYPDGSTKARALAQNWMNWAEALPAGDYKWTVQATNATGTKTSRQRQFTVAAGATAFLLPDAATMASRAAAKGHPRGLPDAATLAAMVAARPAGLAALKSYTDAKLGVTPQAEPSGTASDVRDYTNDEVKRTLNALAYYAATKNETYYQEAQKRVLNLASWNASGATSYTSNNEAGRNVAWALALGYDWLYSRLNASQKARILNALKPRAAAMYNDLVQPRWRAATAPRDTLANQSVHTLAAISTLLSGDVAEADTWMGWSVNLAAAIANPWGGDDGGAGNGTAAAGNDVGDALLPWYVLRWTVGVDFGAKASVRNLGKFLGYFVPPGSPAGAFGDAAEQATTEVWSRVGRALTNFAPSSVGNWRGALATGEDAGRIESLLAPLPSGATSLAAGTANSAFFPSVGWMAMHSDLAQASRTSVYFKSSALGSLNHSHADQNSFVVNAGGKALAIDSGYYDWYKSDHWNQWYKQTRAHNAITFDGGQGQDVYEANGRGGAGAVTGNVSTAAYDIVSGDATAAYGGALTLAERSVTYLRPNLIVVYDELASATPRTWEWNIHAVNQMAITGGRVVISNGDQTLCVTPLAAPLSAFSQTNQFTAAPGLGNMPNQWHGRFTSSAKSTTAEFVMVLDVGCTNPPSSATKTGGAWTIVVGSNVLTIDANGTRVSTGSAPPPDTPPPPGPPSLPAPPTGACTPGTGADWMTTSNPLDARVKPADCETVTQSPPDFGWPDISNDASYQVTLTYPSGTTRTFAAPQNWINWPESLPAGTYTWTVQKSNSAGSAASRARKFIVASGATAFVVPDGGTLLSRVLAKAHPRSIPDTNTVATMRSQRNPAVTALLADITARVTNPLPNPPTSSQEDWMRDECKRITNSMMAYIYTSSDVAFNDVVRRVMNVSAWDPRGATSYANTDMGSRALSWCVAQAYDVTAPRLTAAQKSTILGMLKVRMGDMYNDIIGTRSRLAKYPRDSHGNQSLMMLGTMASMVAGDLPEAGPWVSNVLPLAANALSPWGGDDGGFVNSAAQGVWDVGEQLVTWYAVRYTAGLDFAQKPWVKNWATYQAYFMPPGQNTQVFGDGLEMNLSENLARFGKGYAFFAPSGLSRWYASNRSGEDTLRAEYLQAPPADFTTAAFPTGFPNSTLLRSIGWAAMHSDLGNLNRTSVYFKSSPAPFGAFNHSHADQNSFVVNAGGQRMAIETGYYDGYKTQHWWNWYHQTKAKNAITYDGGKGQLFFEQDSKMGYGNITQYETTSGYDVVTGDASSAYGPSVTKAVRSMVYLRPGLILVYDNLASATARTWEWNLHAVNQMSVTSNTKVQIANGGQTLCVDMLSGPAMQFTQSNAFASAPSSGGAAQWHGKFANSQPLAATEFVALLRVGCSATTASATKSGGAWTVNAGSNVVTIDAAGTVSVR